MVGTILFAVLALVALISAVGMVTARNGIHAAMFLVLNFLCIALFYLGLNAPFLAMVQITVYAGAIMVLFIFVIMLLGAERVTLESTLQWQPYLALALVVALIATAGVIFFLGAQGEAITFNPVPLVGEVAAENPAENFGSPQAVGMSLYSDFMLPFQIVGLLLLVGMIGAVVLAGQAKEETDDGPKRRRYVDPEELRSSTLTSVTPPSGDK